VAPADAETRAQVNGVPYCFLAVGTVDQFGLTNSCDAARAAMRCPIAHLIVNVAFVFGAELGHGRGDDPSPSYSV
jgi:hypothetical protein